MERGLVAARIEFPRPPSKREIEVRAQIGWYEAVRYEHLTSLQSLGFMLLRVAG